MLDARIPLGVQPMQIEPRSNALMRAAQLQGAQDNNALRQMQMQQMRAAAEQALKDRQMAAERQQQMEGYLASLSGRMGPPQQFNPMEAAGMFGIDGAKKLQDLVTPANSERVMAPGSVLVRDGKPVFTAPTKPEATPAEWRLYELSGAKDRGVPFDQWNRDNKRSGATSVSVGAGQKPVPASVIKTQDELIDRMTTARAIDADLAGIEQQINSGALQFGPVINLFNQGKNMAGLSDEQSRAFASFKSTLEKLRNDSLKLNSGVQTEGDAQRAWNELFQNINDTKLVQQRLQEIRRINQRAAQLQKYRLDVLRENFGAGELPAPNVQPAIQPPQQRPVKRTGTHNGRKVVEYADGSIEYDD